MSSILTHHHNRGITYELDEEADKLYEQIVDKFNDQYNLKYTSASQISASQPDLNMEEKAELCVRTKATEIIGRLACILWIYCNGKCFYIKNMLRLVFIRFLAHYMLTHWHFSISVCARRKAVCYWDPYYC